MMRNALSARILATALGVALGVVAAPTMATAAPNPDAATAASAAVGPQNLAARSGAEWLVGQVNAQGYVPTATTPAKPDLSSTAQIPLALAAANVAPATAKRMLSYVAGHLQAYVTQGGSDGPSQLALLILDAHALGQNPASFGGTDLVSRLLATQQAGGTDKGLFGTQSPTYTATFRQGLSLAALAAVGDTAGTQVSAAVSWLEAQQCPDGGWASYQATLGCTVTTTFLGPDTNSTALAIEGLAAQGALTPADSAAATGFLEAAQGNDGGWGLFPSTQSVAGVSDPDSTSLVVQALLAMGLSPTAPLFAKAGGAPVPYIESQQVTSGTGAGAFVFPVAAGGSGTPDVIATYQAVPALAGLAVPFGASGGSYWLTGSDGGVFALGQAGYYGSLPGRGVHVTDIAAMAPMPDGRGYLLAGSDGGVYAFGDATFAGSLPGLGLDVHDVVAAATTPDGAGYWLVGADGGVYAFGDAHYFGSVPGLGVTADDVVVLVATPDGRGYWLVGADGGVFAFGDARYHGSLPAVHASVTDVVGATASADGGGYLLVGADGGAFAFGDAAFAGSLPGLGATVRDVQGSSATPGGAGYVMAGADGGVFAFGDATFPGSLATTPLAAPIVAVAASPARSMG
jgi:hypothetical protein